jgi:transcriptional regulator with XRE-family HTH domain
MKDRLFELKETLGVQWKQLADLLEISVPMLGCLRRGERKPSPNLATRIEELEKNGIVPQVTTIDWKRRALDAEKRLAEINDAVSLILDGTTRLQKAMK